MPVYPISFFVPKSSSIPYLLEDTYLKGSLRVLANIAARDAIPNAARKIGMVVITSDTKKIWQLQSDGLTYKEIANYTGAVPISVVDNVISIDAQAILPPGGNPGDVLSIAPDNTRKWLPVVGSNWNGGNGSGGGTGSTGSGGNGSSSPSPNGSGSSSKRFSLTYTTANIAPLGTVDFELALPATALLLTVTVDKVGIKTEAFSEPLRIEPNPYTFISYTGMLSDQGITKYVDGSVFKGRRYSILANLENPVKDSIYWRITNTNLTAQVVVLTVTYIAL